MAPRATANAIRTAHGISAGLVICHAQRVAGRLMPTASASWNASVPSFGLATCPVIATSGVESMRASARAVRRLVAPGPEVPMHTPGRPVARA